MIGDQVILVGENTYIRDIVSTGIEVCSEERKQTNKDFLQWNRRKIMRDSSTVLAKKINSYSR